MLRREYNGFFAFVLVMFAFEAVSELVTERRFVFDAWWLWLLGSSLVIWLTLRTLKKHTTVLDVVGR